MNAFPDNILICYVCPECGKEYYFSPDSLPGGPEHCEYSECCWEELHRIDEEK